MTEATDQHRHPASLLNYICRSCGAAVGDKCRTKSGAVSYDSHAARYEDEGAYYRVKVPCGTCGTPVMRAYMPPTEVCTECA